MWSKQAEKERLKEKEENAKQQEEKRRKSRGDEKKKVIPQIMFKTLLSVNRI